MKVQFLFGGISVCLHLDAIELLVASVWARNALVNLYLELKLSSLKGGVLHHLIDSSTVTCSRDASFGIYIFILRKQTSALWDTKQL